MIFSPGERIQIPSPIDVHAHLREPGGEDRETIASGTQAALFGGYQAVFDMPNNPAPHQTWSEERLDEKIDIAVRTASTNIGFYAGMDVADPALEEVPGMVRKSAGLKLYMDHTTGNTSSHGLESVREIVDTWIGESQKTNELAPILLHARDETGAETARYIASRNFPVHWCHIASELEVKLARQLTKDFPERYTGGVTPHHLTMTTRNADFQQGWHGARMQPPLGGEVDADALLHAYINEDIQILETDHAPHLAKDKLNAERANPSGDTGTDCVTCFGVSGIEFVLPVMMSLVQRGKVTMERLVDSLHDQPIRMLGLQGCSDATTELVIDPYVIEKEDIESTSENTPYVGWTAWAWIAGVAIDGSPRLSGGEQLHREKTPRILRTGSLA